MRGKEVEVLRVEKESLTAQLAALKLRVEDLVVDKKDLTAQVGRLQEALVAKESPDAYRDQKLAEEEAQRVDTRTPEERARDRDLAVMNRQLLIETESDLFSSAEEMHDLLASEVLKGKMKEIYPETAQGDGES